MAKSTYIHPASIFFSSSSRCPHFNFKLKARVDFGRNQLTSTSKNRNPSTPFIFLRFRRLPLWALSLLEEQCKAPITKLRGASL
ncbi:hypothetical protein CCACVL1_09993 [Corchorus capsularis]|uniref:Uncharacterized protein n=1 Tax=Corchorus capsularis TaxID=210143 RepID=A0A1R3ITB3_COCAP|nr:hypothetical protein CCACVL1_09993 [Corchorus capsularis]